MTGPVSDALRGLIAPSTDFTTVVDVWGDGRAYNVSDGIVRRRYAADRDPAAADPIPVEIALWPTSIVFRQGHRIRLEIASSNFPRFDRNPNTGAPIATATVTAVATQAVHHGPRTQSRIILPVVASGASR